MAASTDEGLADVVFGELNELLDNIKETRANIESGNLKVVNLPDVVQMTEQDLGVQQGALLWQALNSKLDEYKDDDFGVDLALAALSITAAIVASVASGGLAAFALGFSLGVGGAQAARSTKKFLVEKAAEDVAPDPRIADISAEEPDLKWVVLDLVSLGLDAATVVKTVKLLSVPAKSDDVFSFANTARRALSKYPGAAEKVMASFSQQAKTKGIIRKILERVRNIARKRLPKTSVAELIERYADQGYRQVYDKLTLVELTEENLKVYDPKVYNWYVKQNKPIDHYHGLFSPFTDIIFVKSGSEEYIANVTIHEIAHYLQKYTAPNLETFIAEYEAFTVESEMARRMIDAGLELPEEFIEYAKSSPEELARKVEDLYKIKRPTNYDLERASWDIFVRLWSL